MAGGSLTPLQLETRFEETLRGISMRRDSEVLKGVNVFTTGNPFGEKLLGISIGRGSEALQGVR